MNLLDWINQGITNLVNTSSPSIDALGFRMFVALLTTMMVWFGSKRRCHPPKAVLDSASRNSSNLL
jgi:hypothetical protein